MSHQDWEPVILRKKPVTVSAAEAKKNPLPGTSVTKFDAGKNKQTSKPSARADVDITDPDAKIKPIKTYDSNFRKNMQQARQEKNLSQKDLATKLNVKPNVIAEIESGKAQWDGTLVTRIERILGSLRK
jgi:putative transcription factor